MNLRTTLLACALTLPCALVAADPVFDAMQAELKRTLTLSLQDLEKPYYVSYAVDDGKAYTAVAVQGALISSNVSRFRYPALSLRVGTYDFDNTNFAGGGSRGASYNLSGFPLDDDPAVIRQYLWLETDSAYKGALQSISRKRAALRGVTQSEKLPDFTIAKPFTLTEERAPINFDDKLWTARVKKLSGVFNEFPTLRASVVEYQGLDGIHRFVSSEGTQIRQAQAEGSVQLRASAQAPDGMIMRDFAVFYTQDLSKMFSEDELTKAARNVGGQLTKMAAAPVGDNYSGPILFEGVSSAQLMADVLGRSLHINRKLSGGGGSGAATELEGRRGVRIMPEMFDVTDDPTLPLFGKTRVDNEGVPSIPLSIVEKGVLKDFLRTRQPVRGYTDSNGRALIGNFPSPTNLIVKSRETMPVPEMRKKLIDLCQQRGLPFAIVIRKLDFPSTAQNDEARRLVTGVGGHAAPLPLYIYKLYVDGHEEMIRGVKLRGVNARSLKDILFAGDDAAQLDYVDNGATFAMLAGGSNGAEVSVVAPSVLIDDLELVKIEDELPKLPIAPPPGFGPVAIAK